MLELLQQQGMFNDLYTYLIPTAISLVIIFVVYIISAIRRWKFQQAIFKIQKDISEINERQKMHMKNPSYSEDLVPPQTPTQPPIEQ